MAGSRKQYELVFQLRAALGGNFSSTFASAANTMKNLQGVIGRINSVQKDISGFKKQQEALQRNRDKMQGLQEEHERLQREIRESGQPTEKLTAQLQRNEKQIRQTQQAIIGQESSLDQLGARLREAGVNTNNLDASTERLRKQYERLQRTQENIGNINSAIEKNNSGISETKMQLAGVAGGAMALGAAFYAGPIKRAAELQAQMSKVKAISGANIEEMQLLTEKAKEMGRTTKFTAAEAGEAMEYMAMAGWKTSDMLNGLEGIMSLAAASGEDLGSVSDIVTDALTAFGMTAAESGRFADVLAAASSNANTDVAMMGATFQKVAPVAGALGYTVEDMSLAIGLMANASIKAEVAGTSLKTSLANMAKPTKQQKAYMDKYNISLTRTDGTMKTFDEVVTNLRSSLGGLSEQQQVAAATAIFGKESFAGMLAVVNATEADYDKLKASIQGCDGAAKNMADTMLDNFEGKLTLAQSALDGLMVALGEALLPALTSGIESFTEIISRVAEFAEQNPELVKTIAKVTAGLFALKAGGLVAKLGFQEIKGGVLTVNKIFEIFKGRALSAQVQSAGLGARLMGMGGSMRGYFSSLGGAFGNLFSSSRILSGVAGIGGKAGRLLTSGVMGGLGKLTGAAGGLFGKLGTLVMSGPLGKMGGFIASGAGKAAAAFAPLGRVFSTAFAPLGKLGGGLFSGLGGVIGKLMPIVTVITLIIAAIQIFRDHLDDIRNFIGNTFGSEALAVFDKIVAMISNIGETIKGIFSEGNLASAREFINGIFGEQGVQIFNGIIQVAQTLYGVFQEFIGFVDTSVKPILESLFSFVVNEILPIIAEKAAEWLPQIAVIIQGLWDVISMVCQNVMAVISFLMPTIQGIISTGVEMISGIIDGLLQVIQGIIDFVGGVFTGDWQRAWNGVKNIFSGVWEAIKAVAKGAINGVIEIINTLIRGLNKLKIPDWVPGAGGKGINIQEIPKFAKGARRTPDTFIAGERGAELVTNARNRSVFTALQTQRIFNNMAAQEGVTNSVTGLPSVSVGSGTINININYNPAINAGGGNAEEIAQMLREAKEAFLAKVKELVKQALAEAREQEARVRYA